MENGVYPITSKKTKEKIIASTHARKRCHALINDLFLDGCMQKMVNIPADTKLVKPNNCASVMETGVPIAVFIVR